MAVETRMYKLALAFAVVSLLGCEGRPQPAVSGLPDCQVAGSSTTISKQCALAITQNYAMREYPKLKWVRFDAKFDEQDGVWVGHAEHEPNVPGNYFVLTIAPDGRILSFQGGQ